MQLVFDQIENSRVEDSNDGITIVRSGNVLEIPTLANAPVGVFDPSVLITALSAPGMPQIGDEHPIRPEARVKRRLVFPTSSHNIARIEVHYNRNRSSGGFVPLPNTKFRIVRDATTMLQEPSQLSADGDPLIIYYQKDQASPILSRVFSPMKRIPVRTVVAYGSITGPPQNSMIRAQGMVNSQTFLDLPKGYWFCSGLDISFPQAGQRFVTATFVSKLRIDWGEYGVFRDDRGQTPSDISKTGVQKLRAADYTTGVLGLMASNDVSYNGLIKTGLYEMADLGQLFPIEITDE